MVFNVTGNSSGGGRCRFDHDSGGSGEGWASYAAVKTISLT